METQPKPPWMQSEDELVIFRPEDKGVAFQENAPISNPPTEEEIQEHLSIVESMSEKERYIFSKVRDVAEEKIKLLVEGMGFASYETMTRFFLYEQDDEDAVGFHSVVENEYGMDSRAIRVSWDSLKNDELRESVATVIHEKIHNLAKNQEIQHESGAITIINGLRVWEGLSEKEILLTKQSIDTLKVLLADSNTGIALGLLIDALKNDYHVFGQEAWKTSLQDVSGLDQNAIEFVSRLILTTEIASVGDLEEWLAELDLENIEEGSITFRFQEKVLASRGEALDEATVEFLSQYAVGLERVVSDSEESSDIKPVNFYAKNFAYEEWTGIWIDSATEMSSEDTRMFIQALKEAEFRSNPAEIISFFKNRFDISIEMEKLENMDLEDLPEMIREFYRREEQEEQDRLDEIEQLRKRLQS